jgi:hypothetical protein
VGLLTWRPLASSGGRNVGRHMAPCVPPSSAAAARDMRASTWAKASTVPVQMSFCAENLRSKPCGCTKRRQSLDHFLESLFSVCPSQFPPLALLQQQLLTSICIMLCSRKLLSSPALTSCSNTTKSMACCRGSPLTHSPVRETGGRASDICRMDRQGNHP